MAVNKTKLYYCAEKNAVCSVASCSKGKELKHCPERWPERIEVMGDGYTREYTSGRIMTRMQYIDGTEEIIWSALEYRKGCE